MGYVRKIASVILCLGVVTAVSAQANLNALRQLDFSLDELEQMEEIQEMTIEIAQPAQAQINVIKQKLTRLLLRSEVNLEEVERLLRQSLQWELKVRMAEITRQIEIRRIVGDQRWAAMLRVARLLRDPENVRRLENTQLGERLDMNPNLRARVFYLLRSLTRG